MSRILRAQAVKEKTGLSRATIYRYMNMGQFPKPITLGANSVGWLEKEINEWIDIRIERRGIDLKPNKQIGLNKPPQIIDYQNERISQAGLNTR